MKKLKQIIYNKIDSAINEIKELSELIIDCINEGGDYSEIESHIDELTVLNKELHLYNELVLCDFKNNLKIFMDNED